MSSSVLFRLVVCVVSNSVDCIGTLCSWSCFGLMSLLWLYVFVSYDFVFVVASLSVLPFIYVCRCLCVSFSSVRV